MIYVLKIPHQKQRYDTVGDWWVDDLGTLQVRVSDMPNRFMVMAVAIHEIIEACICIQKGIRESDITAWDIRFGALDPESLEEPGDAPGSPYHFAHAIASGCERIFIAAAGVNWKEYEDAVNNVS